jgi:hypothetical protein
MNYKVGQVIKFYFYDSKSICKAIITEIDKDCIPPITVKLLKPRKKLVFTGFRHHRKYKVFHKMGLMNEDIVDICPIDTLKYAKNNISHR